MTLETLLVKEREVFGTYHEDKRVKDAKAIVKKAYESHPTFNTGPPPAAKQSWPNQSEDWAWETPPKKRRHKEQVFVADALKAWQHCHNYACIQDWTSRTYTSAACPKQSSPPHNHRHKGQGGKGGKKAKPNSKGAYGRGKGPKGKPEGGKNRSKGSHHSFKGGKSKNTKGKHAKGKSSERIPSAPYVEGQPFRGSCFFCKKWGHRRIDCAAYIEMRKQPVFVAKAANYTGDHAHQLVLLLNAAGTETCNICLHPL